MRDELKLKIEKRESTLNDVRDLLISSLKLPHSREELDPDIPLFGSGLGLDSIDAVMLVVDLETKFNVVLNAEENIEVLRSINCLVDTIMNNVYETKQ